MMRLKTGSPLWYSILGTALLAAGVLMSCSGGEDISSYQAEKELFRARKMSSELTAATIQSDFLARTLDAYRGIVERYGPRASDSKELDLAVVSAQMELAQLEFQAGMLHDALRDFNEAIKLAVRIPEARANAIYSSASISEQINDTGAAIDFYERFYKEYIEEGGYSNISKINSRYLVVPLKIGNLYSRAGEKGEARRWYERAEKLYTRIISTEDDPALVREARFNSLTSLIQNGRWENAKERLKELKKDYGDGKTAPALLYLESQIELNGFGDTDKAIALLGEIADKYPGSNEAPGALITRAEVLVSKGRREEAAAICRKIIKDYPDKINEVVKATWMLAAIEEEKGNWVDASLHYKSIYTKYPLTLQGLEAPLRIAEHFTEIGEKEAARGAYATAREHYSGLAGDSYARGARVIAEKYYVRTLIEEKKWEEAVNKLLEQAAKYPRYTPFMQNYLSAASICELELGDNERAASILEMCIEKHGGTGLAEEAEKQLKRIRGQE